MVIKLFQRKRLATSVVTFAFIWLFTWSQSVPSQLLLHSLEYRFDIIDVNDPRWQQADYISVLACGHYPDETLPQVSRWPRCSMQRLLQGVRMYQISSRPVIVSGGMILESEQPFAVQAKALLMELGVNEADIIVVPHGENTHQEAKAIRAVVDDKRVALVTSASHMQRAVNYFNSQQIEIIPVPVDHSGLPEISYKLTVPSSKNLQKAYNAFREYLGLIYQHIELRGES
ncbi:YdcF family protein [Alteromonas halophila]|nr:YdcF family protein [Alteromonas halophila]